MLRYRTFCNIDPPAVAAIWRSRVGQRGLTQPVSMGMIEQRVFAKLYFDYSGLFLAFDDDRPVGFAHAGFGPNDLRDRIWTETGVTCMVMVRPDCAESEVAAGLLERCEDYLVGHGAKVLYGGSASPMNPFYLGLYGGSQLPGVLDSDVVAINLYRTSGYGEADRTFIFRRELADFRAPVSRQQLHCRRCLAVQTTVAPPPRDWWEACTSADFELIRFDLVAKGGTEILATAVARDMQSGVPTASRTVGLIDIRVEPDCRRQGYGMFLLGESFRLLAEQGFTAVEAHARQQNTAWVGMAGKLGVELTQEGTVFRKDL